MQQPDADAVARRSEVVIAGHRGDVEVVRAALDDPADIVRASALGALERTSALDPTELLVALGDPSGTVRRRALAIAATRGPDVELDRRLEHLLGDADTTVAETAAWAIGERPPAPARTVDALCRMATSHDDALCREAAVAALGALGDAAGLGAILQATTDRATVRRRAVIALAPFEGPEVDAALARALEDRDWQVRQAAEDLLAD